MELKFSDNLKNMKPSEIRELLKFASNKNLISFGGGMPNPLSFPMPELKSIVEDVMDQYGSVALQYGNTGGLGDLRTELKNLMRDTESINSSEESIIVTSGSQQALYELTRIFVNPGDAIITEEPTYVGAVSAFDAGLADMHSIPMDNQGVLTDLMETEIKKLISTGRKPKFIYVIPNFQNPKGVTMSLDRRKHVIEISRRYEIPVVEDNPYGELRYEGTRIPALKSLDNDVIYLGTFSKIMCPGFRLGFIVGPDNFISRVNLLKQALDLSSSTFSQFVAWQYLKRGMVKKQIPKTIELYRGKRNIMLDALSEHFPDGSTWSHPQGGMFIWATVDKSINTTEMLPDAIKDGVGYVSGNAFSPARAQGNSMRLNFTFSEDEQIREGIKRLGTLIERKLAVIQPQ